MSSKWHLFTTKWRVFVTKCQLMLFSEHHLAIGTIIHQPNLVVRLTKEPPTVRTSIVVLKFFLLLLTLLRNLSCINQGLYKKEGRYQNSNSIKYHIDCTCLLFPQNKANSNGSHSQQTRTGT